MIFLSASVWQILAVGIDGFHTNQCIIMQQEFAQEFGEISPSVCSFSVDEPLVVCGPTKTNQVRFLRFFVVIALNPKYYVNELMMFLGNVQQLLP